MDMMQVRALAHRPPAAARTFPQAVRAQLLSTRWVVLKHSTLWSCAIVFAALHMLHGVSVAQLYRLVPGRSDGPHGKSRLRSKSEDAKTRADASTASTEITRLRLHSARKRAPLPAFKATRSAPAQGHTTTLFGSVTRVPDAIVASTNSNSNQAAQRRIHSAHADAQLLSSADEAHQLASGTSSSHGVSTTPTAATPLHKLPGDLQLLQQADASSPARPRRQRRQRAQSVGSTAGSTRTLSVPAVSAAAEYHSASADRQLPALTVGPALAEAPAPEPASLTGAPQPQQGSREQSGGTPPGSPQHRRRRSRSTGPLSAELLSAHAASQQATLRTQSVSTTAVMSCPKLDELLSVLWASGTASKQRAAHQSTRTYSEPWLPLQRSRHPVAFPPGQHSSGTEPQTAEHQPLDYRSLASSLPAADLHPVAPTFGAAAALRLPSTPEITDDAHVADGNTTPALQPQRGFAGLQQGAQDTQQRQPMAASTPDSGGNPSLSAGTAASRQFGGVTPGAGSSQPGMQPRQSAMRWRTGAGTAAQSPFAAPELQRVGTEPSAAQSAVAPAVATSPMAQAPAVMPAQTANSSKGGEAVAVLLPVGGAAASSPVNDYLAIMRGAHSEEPPIESPMRAAASTFESPFSRVCIGIPPPEVQRAFLSCTLAPCKSCGHALIQLTKGALARCRAAAGSRPWAHACHAWTARRRSMGRCCRAATAQPRAQPLPRSLLRLRLTRAHRSLTAASRQAWRQRGGRAWRQHGRGLRTPRCCPSAATCHPRRVGPTGLRCALVMLCSLRN